MTVKATFDYEGRQDDELSFCKHSVITNVVKQDSGWWRGDYGGKRQHWFPSNHVEELQEAHIENSDSGVSSSNYRILFEIKIVFNPNVLVDGINVPGKFAEREFGLDGRLS